MMIKIATTKHKLKKIDPTPIIESRVTQHLQSAKNYLIGKWFFHTISIASTGVMFGVYLPQMLNGPLSEYDLNIKDFATDLALPTLAVSMLASAVLELASTNVTKSAFSELGSNLRNFSRNFSVSSILGLGFSIFLPIFSIGALGALQIYSFGQGAKYSYIKYQLPDSKFEKIKTIEKDKRYYIEQIEELKATQVKVRDHIIKPDSRFGNTKGTVSEIKKLKAQLKQAQEKYKIWEQAENHKKSNFSHGKLKRYSELLYARKKSELVDPIKNKLLSLSSKETDPVKHWLQNADMKLSTLKKQRDSLEEQKEILQTELIALKNKISKKFPDSIYYTVGALLLLILATMDFYYNEYLRRANTTIYNNRKKELPTINESYSLSDIDTSLLQEELGEAVDEESRDEEFLTHIAAALEEDGKIPNSTILARELGKSSRDISKLYAKHAKYFITKQGVATQPTELFLKEYINKEQTLEAA